MREWLPGRDARSHPKKVSSYFDYVEAVVRRGIDEGVSSPSIRASRPRH